MNFKHIGFEEINHQESNIDLANAVMQHEQEAYIVVGKRGASQKLSKRRKKICSNIYGLFDFGVVWHIQTKLFPESKFQLDFIYKSKDLGLRDTVT